MRITAAASLTTVNASAEVAMTVAIPTAAQAAHASTPSELPAVVKNARRRPPRAALRTTMAVAAPGVSDSSAATGRNVTSARNMAISSRISEKGQTTEHSAILPLGGRLRPPPLFAQRSASATRATRYPRIPSLVGLGGVLVNEPLWRDR